MYHAIVRRKVMSLFDAINRGDAEPVMTGFAPAFECVSEAHADMIEG